MRQIKSALNSKKLRLSNTTQNCLPELAGHFLSIFLYLWDGKEENEWGKYRFNISKADNLRAF